MGFVNITKLNADGVETVSISDLSDSERLEIELDLVLGALVEILCTVCDKPLKFGTGLQCELHKSKV
jgi:hypothetical protein